MKGEKIFSVSECLSEEILKGYINNTLSPEEKHKAERHLVDCELCSDALEGFAILKDHRKEFSIGETKAAVGKITETNNNINVWLAAASVVVLVGLGGLLYFFLSPIEQHVEVAVATMSDSSQEKPPVNSDQSVVEEKAPDAGYFKAEKEIVSIDKAKAISKNDNTMPDLLDKNKKEEVVEGATSKAFAEEEKMEQANTSVPMPTPELAKAATKEYDLLRSSPEPVVAGSKDAATENKSISAGTASRSNEISSVYLMGFKMTPHKEEQGHKKSKPKQKTERSRAANFESARIEQPLEESYSYNDQLKKALSLYKAGNYKSCIEKMDLLLSDFPSDVNAMYYKAQCLYNLGEASAAGKLFDRILSDEKAAVFHEDARWYKAMTLFEAGFAEKAKPLLEKIADKPGDYQGKAKEKLLELK